MGCYTSVPLLQHHVLYYSDHLHVAVQDSNILIMIYHYLPVVDVIKCRSVCRYFHSVTYSPLMHHIQLQQHRMTTRHHYFYCIQSYRHAMMLVKCLQLNSAVFDLVDCITVQCDRRDGVPHKLFQKLNQRSIRHSIYQFRWKYTYITPDIYKLADMTLSLQLICQFRQLHTLQLQVTFEQKPDYISSAMLSFPQLCTLQQSSTMLKTLYVRVLQTDILQLLDLFTALEQLTIYVQPVNMDINQHVDIAEEIRVNSIGMKRQSSIKHVNIINGSCSWLLQLQPTYSLCIKYGSKLNFMILRLLPIHHLTIEYVTGITPSAIEPDNDIFGLLFSNHSILSTTIHHLTILSPDVDIVFAPLFDAILNMIQLLTLNICGSVWDLHQILQLRQQQPAYVHPHNFTHPKTIQR